MKRTLLKLLAVCIALSVSIGSTIAYLTDTDGDVNVMTLGRVEIDLIEQEHDDDGFLIAFQDDHPIIPGVYPAGVVTGAEKDFWPESVNNAIDKIVSVTNTGNSAAYVRLWFAFEVTNDELFFDQKLHLNKNNHDWRWDFLTEEDDSYTYLSLDDSRYVAAVATYPQALAVGATTPVSLRQVLLDSSATNEELAVLGEKYSIFVVAQGVQAAGFEDAETALNAGFKAPSAATHPFGEMTEKDFAFMLDEKALRRALDEHIPNDGGKMAVRSVSFGRMSEYVKDVDELRGNSLGSNTTTQNIGMMFFSHALAEGDDAPLVYYRPIENEDGTQYYDVYILYEGTIKLPNNCEGLLANYKNLNSFTTTNLDANEVEKMENFFKGCTNLTKVTLPKGVTEIDASMFAECESLETVSIPGTVEKINENAFQEQKDNILFIVVEKSPAQDWVEDENLSNTAVPEIPQKPDIPFTWRNDGISITITGYTGKDDVVVVPDTIEGLPVTVIGDASFYKCTSLREIDIPDSVEVIDRKAFLGCENLSEITIPDNVYAINEGAFNDCSRLSSITIPKKVTTIGNMVFLGCSSLTEIRVDPDNPSFVSKEGVLFSKDMKILIACPGAKKGHFDIPDGVKTIGQDAFNSCGKLTSIKLPDSITNLGTYAFCNSGLTSITIPGSIKTIPYGVFQQCSNLKEVTIQQGVVSIGNAFWNCSALTSITLPSTISDLGNSGNIFYDSPNVTAMVYSNSYACLWCKQNKVKFQLLDDTEEHVCEMSPVDRYEKYDENYHLHSIYMCYICGISKSVQEAHDFSSGGTCVCGAKRTEAHICDFQSMGGYSDIDGTYHQMPMKCHGCGTVMMAKEEHYFDTIAYIHIGDYDHQATKHCQICEIIIKFIPEAHTFDTSGKCICGATYEQLP